MKNLTKEAVAKIFEANPGYSTLYFAADGEPFLTENYALQYAKDQKLEDKKITAVEKDLEFDETSTGTKTAEVPKADQLIAAIAELKDAEQFKAFALPEGEKRVTVMKAYTDKKAELGIE